MLRLLAILVVTMTFLGQSKHAVGQLIIAHRGASYDAPENTLAAFRLAWKQGADGVEGDFFLSSDGQVVCIHDKDTKRVSGENLIVADTPYEKLRTLDVGSWKHPKWRGERIPTLGEVIETVPKHRKLVIELKVGPEIVAPMVKVLKATKLKTDQVIVISFHPETIHACERLMPELRTHWLTGYEQNDAGQWEPAATKVSETIRRIRADGLGSKAETKFVDGAFLEIIRASEVDEFHVWTVNDLQTARFYQRLGAYSITTDRPGWLRKQLQD